MGYLEKIGLGRKMRGAGYFNERRKDDLRGLKSNKYVKSAIIFLFFVLLLLFFPGVSYKDISYKIGEPWRDDDLTAPFTFSLLKEKDEINREIEVIRANTSPIYYQSFNAHDRVKSRIDSLYRNIYPVLDQYVQWKLSAQDNNRAVTMNDSLRYIRDRNMSGVGIDEQAWLILARDYADIRLFELTRNRPSSRRFIGIDIRQNIERIITDLYNDGLVNTPKIQIAVNEILIRDNRGRTQKNAAKSAVRDLNEAREFARFRLSRAYTEDIAFLSHQLFDLVIEPNLIFNTTESESAVQEAIAGISPTRGAVASGQMIIRKGDLITSERLNMLQSLEVARTARASDLDIWQQDIGNGIVVISIFIVFLLYLYLYRNPIFDDNMRLLLALLALGIVLSASIFVIMAENLSVYLVPTAIAPIILTIIFDSRVGLMTITTLALVVAFMSGNNFEFVVASITAGSIAVYSVRDIKNRSQFFLTTPGLVFASYFLVLLGFTLIKPGGWDILWNNMLFVLGNAFLIWLTYPLILLFEKVFKVTTEVSLLELNDNNHPLLKNLMMRAPGSFQHSLQVANLSESAAASIGANSLLCRVGSLYHDIGKADRPEYFVENQHGQNEHDKLKARMSALVIKNHVSTGLKMADEFNLPNVIIDFIKTHHGTSVIRYFYEKAKENVEKVSEVREEDFKYEGPLPFTKETGILLLADAVEATARTLTEPNYQKIENLVNRIVDERVDEGQLANCPITFQDLRIIKETFRNILVGVYHSRIKYPGQVDEKNQPEKLAEPAQSHTTN